MAMKDKKLHLDSLISSQEDLKARNCLTQKGIDYLDGLKSARKLVFGEPESLKIPSGLKKPLYFNDTKEKTKNNGKGKIAKKR